MTQNTIQFSRANPLQGLQQLARTIALPHEYAPIRYPSFPALERTAVMAFNYNASVTVPASTDTFGLLFRQAVWSLWMDQSFTSQTWQVQYVTDTPNSNVNQTTSMVNNISNWVSGSTPSTTNSTEVLGAVPMANTTYPILGVDATAAVGGREFVYVPPGFNLVVVVVTSTAITTNTFSVYLERWVSPGEVAILTRAAMAPIAGNFMAMATMTFSQNTGYWVRPFKVDSTLSTQPITCVRLVVTAGTPTLNPASNSISIAAVTSFRSIFPVFNPVEFANSQLPWFSTRTTASALLATNVTQVLNKGGTVLAGRVAPQVLNPWQITKSYLSSLHPAEKALIGLEEGFYTYVPPSTDMSEFWDYSIVTTNGAPICPLFRLDNTSLVNAFFFTVPVDSTFALNADLHIEFRTTSTLFQIGMSGLTLESFHQAQLELMSHGFFYNNVDHKKLLSKMKSIQSLAKTPMGKAAVSMAKSVMPPQAKVAMDLASNAVKLLSRSVKTPKPTTLQAALPGKGDLKKKQNKPKKKKK